MLPFPSQRLQTIRRKCVHATFVQRPSDVGCSVFTSCVLHTLCSSAVNPAGMPAQLGALGVRRRTPSCGDVPSTMRTACSDPIHIVLLAHRCAGRSPANAGPDVRCSPHKFVRGFPGFTLRGTTTCGYASLWRCGRQWQSNNGSLVENDMPPVQNNIQWANALQRCAKHDADRVF